MEQEVVCDDVLVGLRLHDARERASMSIADIASITKISTHYLKAIESDQFECIPSRIHAFGFARAFAKAVALDDGAICAALRRQLDDAATETAANDQTVTDHKRPRGVLSRMANSFFSL